MPTNGVLQASCDTLAHILHRPAWVVDDGRLHRSHGVAWRRPLLLHVSSMVSLAGRRPSSSSSFSTGPDTKATRACSIRGAWAVMAPGIVWQPRDASPTSKAQDLGTLQRTTLYRTADPSALPLLFARHASAATIHCPPVPPTATWVWDWFGTLCWAAQALPAPASRQPPAGPPLAGTLGLSVRAPCTALHSDQATVRAWATMLISRRARRECKWLAVAPCSRCTDTIAQNNNGIDFGPPFLPKFSHPAALSSAPSRAPRSFTRI